MKARDLKPLSHDDAMQLPWAVIGRLNELTAIAQAYERETEVTPLADRWSVSAEKTPDLFIRAALASTLQRGEITMNEYATITAWLNTPPALRTRR